MKKLVMALVPFLVLGCGSDPEDVNGDGIVDGVQEPNNVSVVVPATPKGTVSGQVLTASRKPLTGASVAMTIGSAAPQPTVTDDSGNFSFSSVPGGAQVLLTIAKEGYATMRASATVPTSAGTVPINNGNASFGPVALSETNATVKFTLISPSGRPAQGVKATLEVDQAGVVLFGSVQWTSSVVAVDAISDANGVVTFTNAPSPADIQRLGGGYKLVVYAHDENGDGVLESNGLVRFYSGEDLITGANAKPLALSPTYNPGVSLSVDYSNLTALRGGSAQPQHNMLKPGENIHIVFNQPVQEGSIIVGLTNEFGKENITIGKSVTNGGTVLTLSPQGVQAGREYNLYIRAAALNGGSTVSRTVAFFGGDKGQPQAINIETQGFFYDGGNGVAGTRNNNKLDSGEFVLINFNQVMNRYGSTRAQVFFNTDLNGDPSTTIIGEWNPSDNNNSGFNLDAYEPLQFVDSAPVFSFIPSGYTSRFAFTYGNGAATYNSFNAGASIPLVVAFGRIQTPSSDGYQSAWGVPQTSNISVNVVLTAIPAQP